MILPLDATSPLYLWRISALSKCPRKRYSPTSPRYCDSPFSLKARQFHLSQTSRATHYEALGLPNTATRRDIKTAFYRLSKELHPDRNPNQDQTSKDRYLRASEAYAVLHDDRQRRAYDRTLGSAIPPRTSAHPTTTPHYHYQSDLSRRPRATHAWESTRRARPTASRSNSAASGHASGRHYPFSHSHTHPQTSSQGHQHSRTAPSSSAAGRTSFATGRAQMAWEKQLHAEERVKKESGLLRLVQVTGLLIAMSAVAGSLAHR